MLVIGSSPDSSNDSRGRAFAVAGVGLGAGDARHGRLQLELPADISVNRCKSMKVVANSLR
jgi:hypothetical protein